MPLVASGRDAVLALSPWRCNEDRPSKPKAKFQLTVGAAHQQDAPPAATNLPSIKDLLSNRFEFLRARQKVHHARDVPTSAAHRWNLATV